MVLLTIRLHILLKIILWILSILEWVHSEQIVTVLVEGNQSILFLRILNREVYAVRALVVARPIVFSPINPLPPPVWDTCCELDRELVQSVGKAL